MQNIEIPIIDDMTPEKDEHFEVELFDPEGGAKLGQINRTAVTITNDDGERNVPLTFKSRVIASHC